MMDIVVFDNEKAGCEQTKQILEKYAEEKRLSFQIKTVYERDEFIKYIKGNKEVCAAFVDISIGEGPGGMLIAKEINRIAPDVTIIFLTGYIEYVPETNGAKHICFVLKDALEKREL